jgi:5-methylcytosine-specific restriction endonuclease McrA
MSRQEFSAKVRVAAFERAGGRCENCGVRLGPSTGVEYDHVIACAVGGEATLENCSVKCRNCHGAKTAKHDIPAIAKSKRIRNKHINTTDKRRGFRGWRNFRGEVVYR